MKLTKKNIKAAELIRYNANSSGRMSPDCVKRAISLAFDISYTEVAKLLNTRMKELHQQQWNIRSVYGTVIDDLAKGASKFEYVRVPEADRVYLQDFVDNQVDPSLVYLVQTGKKRTVSDHIVCIREGKIFDSWDSREQWIISYYVIGGIQSKSFTDIKDRIKDLATYVVQDLVNNETVKYMQRKKWNYGPIDLEVRTKDYQIIAYMSLMLKPTDEINKKRYYDFKIVLPLTPTMTEEEARAFIEKTGKQRVYDKMWSIAQEEKKLAEEEAIYKQLAEKGSGTAGLSSHYMTAQETRFINSLPGWIRPLITYVNIQDPGQYSDSYSLTIKAHPNDPTRDISQKINFEGYESWQIKDEIERYIKNWEAPFEDYYPADEY